MNRWLKWVLGISVLGLGIWYFFVKEYQYQVTFISNDPPAVMFEHILNWDDYKRGDEDITLISKRSYSEIQQSVNYGDSAFQYKWSLERMSNGGTEITAYISDTKNGFQQKLSVPFGSNDFVNRSISNVRIVADSRQLLSKTYRVHSITDSVVPPKYCAYLPLQSTVDQKASTMLRGITIIMDYIKSNGIELTGDPFLEVTDWDEDKELITFNFCFPVKELDSMPSHSVVLLKTSEQLKGLKAEFNGNYRNSDVAWYYLLDHADENGLNVKKLPFEIYQNDPHAGGDPLKWKAQVFLPLNE
jgi:hypothetical protein